MDSVFGRRTKSFSMKTISDFTNLDLAVTRHLSKVFATLTGLVAISALGAYFQIITNFSTTISGVLAFFLLLGVVFTGFSTTSPATRLTLLFTFGFFEGASIGSLIDHVIQIDPMLIVVAFLATTTIFACFAGFAILSQRRSLLYLGGYLSSAISVMLLFSFFNIFFNSNANYFIQLYFGLLVFMGYVVFDTQMIIEKASLGDRDFVSHSLDLFIDFVAIFVRILIILANNNKKKRNDDRD
eukprot:gene9418-1625_t